MLVSNLRKEKIYETGERISTSGLGGDGNKYIEENIAKIEIEEMGDVDISDEMKQAIAKFEEAEFSGRVKR